ncbi:MAG: hypothetical protein Q7R70_04315 [Candidatus Diapherotrites archaeon]|nr:hypothetical protein [Candidatus Diapherotrites archaeon]
MNRIQKIGIAILIIILLAAIIFLVLSPGFGPIGEGGIPVDKVAADRVKYGLLNNTRYLESPLTTFNKMNPTLNGKSIAQQSKNISPTQLCIGKGDFSANNTFQFIQTENNVILRYSGNSQRARLGIICDAAKRLAADLQNQSIATGEMQCGDGGTSFPDKSETYCVLILRNA